MINKILLTFLSFCFANQLLAQNMPEFGLVFQCGPVTEEVRNQTNSPVFEGTEVEGPRLLEDKISSFFKLRGRRDFADYETLISYERHGGSFFLQYSSESLRLLNPDNDSKVMFTVSGSIQSGEITMTRSSSMANEATKIVTSRTVIKRYSECHLPQIPTECTRKEVRFFEEGVSKKLHYQEMTYCITRTGTSINDDLDKGWLDIKLHDGNSYRVYEEKPYEFSDLFDLGLIMEGRPTPWEYYTEHFSGKRTVREIR